MKQNLKMMVKRLTEGEVTLRKTEMLALLAVVSMAGIVWGMFLAPWSHGVNIGSYCGNHYGRPEDECTEEDCCCCEE